MAASDPEQAFSSLAIYDLNGEKAHRFFRQSEKRVNPPGPHVLGGDHRRWYLKNWMYPILLPFEVTVSFAPRSCESTSSPSNPPTTINRYVNRIAAKTAPMIERRTITNNLKMVVMMRIVDLKPQVLQPELGFDFLSVGLEFTLMPVFILPPLSPLQCGGA